MTIEIEYFDDIGKLQADPRAAPALSQARTPFDRPEWWQLLVEECGLEPLIALAHNDDGTLVWPLAKQGRKVTALANYYSFRAGPLASSELEWAPHQAAIIEDLAGSFSRAKLAGMDAAVDKVITSMNFRKTGWLTDISDPEPNYVLRPKGRDYATYLSDRPGPLRTTLKRKSKHFETRITTVFSSNDFADYRAIYEASWKPAEKSFEFWRRFCEYEGTAERLRFGFATSEGKPVAAQIWTVEHGTAFIHKLAHVPEAERLSPGTVLTAALMKYAIDCDKVDLVDFGTGDDAYKRDWMEEVRGRVTIDAVRPASPYNWPWTAKHMMRRLHHRLVRPTQPRYAPLAARESATMATSQATDTANRAVTVHANASPDYEIDAKLREVLVDILALDEARVAGFDAQTGLFGHVPELDSQAVATLLTEVEDRFAIVIDDEDVDGEMLETYGGLLAFVRAKCAAAA